MIFQKPNPKISLSAAETEEKLDKISGHHEEVDTVVGPSVSVEGDFVSEGNIIVKGTVSGSVRTSKFLLVEPGAKILANVSAGSGKIAGEVKGNLRIKESLELTATAKVLGDIEAKVLMIEGGAILYGKVTMPGVDLGEVKAARQARVVKKTDEIIMPN